MRALVASPPADGVQAVQTIHYLVLKHWWSTSMALEEGDYLALGRLVRTTEDIPSMRLLRDRALCLFSRRWNEWVDRSRRSQPLPDELRGMAAEVYAELCRLHLTYRKEDKEKLPKPLRGLDAARLEAVWPLDRQQLDEVLVACRLEDGDPEAEAEALFRQMAKAMNEGRGDAAREMIDALLGRYRATSVVSDRLQQIESARAQLA
jgi:hypothetical protein